MVNSIKYGISIIWYVIILFLQKEFHMNTLECYFPKILQIGMLTCTSVVKLD